MGKIDHEDDDEESKMRKKLIVLMKDDEQVRAYHANFEISGHPDKLFLRPLRNSSEDALKLVGEKASMLLKGLFKINGIVSVRITSYSLVIRKGVAFDWEDIHPMIVKTFLQFLNLAGPGGLDVEIRKPDKARVNT
jgi:hypothetical protein